MSRKTASLFYPLLVYLSLIEPISLFSIIPILFYLYNRVLKRYAWVYFILGTVVLLIAFFFFQMTTLHELIAIISASLVALILREAEKVPFWAILVAWLGLLGWFSGPLAVFCVLLVVWMEWEWYKNTVITIVLLLLLFFPLPLRTSVWWLPKYNVVRETPQHFGFHNYEGKYHHMPVEGDPGAGTKSPRVSFANTKTWMESIVDWTVFILAFLFITLLIRLLFMLRQIRFKVSPYILRSLVITGISTLVTGSIVLFYRMAFMNFGDLPPDSPITAIIRQFKEPTVVSTVNPHPVTPIQTVIRSIPPAVQYTILIIITLCLLVAVILLARIILQTFQFTLTPEKIIKPSQGIIKKTEPPKPIGWNDLETLSVSEMIDKVYTYLRALHSHAGYLTPYEYLKHYPSEALQTWTHWIVSLHYAPVKSASLPTRETVKEVFTRLPSS